MNIERSSVIAGAHVVILIVPICANNVAILGASTSGSSDSIEIGASQASWFRWFIFS